MAENSITTVEEYFFNGHYMIKAYRVSMLTACGDTLLVNENDDSNNIVAESNTEKESRAVDENKA